jgi:hypothetical protein
VLLAQIVDIRAPLDREAVSFRNLVLMSSSPHFTYGRRPPEPEIPPGPVGTL